MINFSPVTNSALSHQHHSDDLAYRRRMKAIRKQEAPSTAAEWKARIKKIHIPDGNWVRAKEAFDQVVARTEDIELEAVCTVVSGPPGAGKSHAIQRFMNRPELQPSEDEYGPLRPVLYVETPTACNPGQLGEAAFMNATGRELPGRMTVIQTWRAVAAQMRGQGTSILILDEFHHIFGQNDLVKRAQTVSLLKTLLFPEGQRQPLGPKKFPLEIVIGGIPTVNRIIARDSQLSDRHNAVVLQPLSFTEKGMAEMTAFLRTISEKLEFPAHCDLSSYEMTLRFMKASDGYTGRAMRFIKRAASDAINVGKSSIGRLELGAVLKGAYNLPDAKNAFLVADPDKCPVLPAKIDMERTRLPGSKKEEEALDE